MALLDLPTELFDQILYHLRHHDLAQLSCVSKPLQRMLEPLLWESIEFHALHFHPGRPKNVAGDPKNDNWIHPNLEHDQEGPDQLSQKLIEMGFRFLEVCQALRRERPMRWKQLSARVRSLCMTVKPQWRADHLHGDEQKGGYVVADAWNTLLSFENLETLDVIACHAPLPDPVPIENGHFPLVKLRSLRLRGYVPEDFARSVYHLAPSLERLDLGMIDDPKGLEDWEIGCRTPPAYEELEKWMPRPLVGIFDRDTHHSAKLSHVCLCKPSDPDEADDVYRSDWQDYGRDERSLKEWATMLDGIRGSVVELTLEHRAPISGVHGVGPETMVESYPDHPGSKRFHELVVPTLLNGEWPKLRRLEFRGIYIPKDDTLGRRSKLEAQLPDVSVETNAGKYIFFGYGFRNDVEQGHNEDGLLPDSAYGDESDDEGV